MFISLYPVNRGVFIQVLRLLVETVELPKEIIDMIWDNSLRKACAAHRLCEIYQPDMADAAYCVGLIQDIGLPMLIAADLDYYRHHIATMTHRVAWTDHEREHFGFDHCSVGQGLLQEWGAADTLQKMVLDHHLTPAQSQLDDNNLVHLAGFFAGLIPHLDEDPGPESTDWINAIHARFLMTEYPSPDQFFVEIADLVFKIQSRQAQQDFHETDRLIRHLTRQVTNNMMSMTTKLSYLEQRDRQQQEGIATLKFQAFTDGLTHVLNRRGFTQLGERRLRAAVERGTGVCCMLGDLDDFKSMNDNYGHDIGDLVLRGLVKLLRRRLNETDLIGRIGGDEFAIFVTDITEQDAHELAKRLVGSIRDKAVRVRDDLEVTMSFSLGALYSDKGLENTNIDDLLRTADQLMYEKKRSGKNGLQFRSIAIAPPEQVVTNNPQTLTRREDRPAEKRKDPPK
jgi:diguanylate cyclase (GGDEF)-like protein